MSTTDPAPRIRRLTPRQAQVAKLLRQGHTQKEIAARLGISTRTVEEHASQIRKRKNRATTLSAIFVGKGDPAVLPPLVSVHELEPSQQVGPALRFQVLERDNFTCRYCGRKAPDVVLEVDHILPRARGGTRDPSNLVTACKDCNQGKRDRVLMGTVD